MRLEITNFQDQPIPYWLYRRINLAPSSSASHFRVIESWQIDYGYCYLLRRVIARWPAVNPWVPTRLVPQLFLEFFSSSGISARQTEPIPINCITTPAEGRAELVLSSIPADSPASQVGLGKILNYPYPYRGHVEVHVTGQFGGVPPYLDLILMGYYLPERSLPLHGV